jgi:hypothetical protein
MTPVYLMEGQLVPERGFARTDLEFGTGDEKSPAILCGSTAGQILRGAKLRGIHLVPI